jgi:hypothetical protein
MVYAPFWIYLPIYHLPEILTMLVVPKLSWERPFQVILGNDSKIQAGWACDFCSLSDV